MKPIAAFFVLTALGGLAACSSSSSSASSGGGNDIVNGSGDDAQDPDNDGGSRGTTGEGKDSGAPTTSYSSVKIDFDDLTGAPDVTDQYATHATFSSGTGDEPIHVEADSSYFGTSAPNFVCSEGCTGDYAIDFTKPVKNLKFMAIGTNATTSIAQIEVYVSGSLAKTVDLVGNGDYETPDPVDLSTFEGVTRIEITSITDDAGIGIDDITFDFPD